MENTPFPQFDLFPRITKAGKFIAGLFNHISPGPEYTLPAATLEQEEARMQEYWQPILGEQDGTFPVDHN